MNKTVSIHLQGIPFILEEQAYERLNQYLIALRNVLQQEEGHEEIIQDVELRIVELMQAHLQGSKQVVELLFIEEILTKLGKPEDFSADVPKPQTNTSQETDNKEKRLFRDGDHAVMGGVCAGVAAYFNIDVVLVRAIYVLAFFTLGVGFFLYIILWIIIPEAKTSSEKLQMKGQTVTVENMKSELEQAAGRIKKGAKEIKKNKEFSKAMVKIIRIISICLGLGALLFGTSVLIITLIFLFVQPAIIPAQLDGTFMSLQELGILAFDQPQHLSYLTWGGALISLAIVSQCYLFGIRLIKSFKMAYFKYVSLTSTLLFVVGFILASIGGIQFGRSMAIYGEVEKELGSFQSQSLNIILQEPHTRPIDGFKTKSHGDEGLLTLKRGRIYFDGVELKYTRSADSILRITQINDAQGRTHEMALNKARHIKCPYKLRGNNLTLSSYYSFPAKDKLRDQNVKLLIAVPEGGSIKYNGLQVYPNLKEATQETVSHGYISGDGEYSEW